MLRRSLVLAACAAACLASAPAGAVGTRVDVQIVDRDTGRILTPILHDGQWWIAGRPGARYRVTLANRDGRRTLSVLSVDGVNAISGDTAAWDQSGYVLSPWDRTDVDGWRKSQQQVAAFEFAALSDSYAARTGRPANVGVIGVAVFDERAPVRTVRDAAAEQRLRRAEPVDAPALDDRARPESRADTLAPPPPASPSPSTDGALDKAAPARGSSPPVAPSLAERLGTGHGAIEDSPIQWVAFRRARSTPDEIVTIHYDRLENLIAMGIVPPPASVARRPPVDPFPDSRRYVPDPPPR